MLSRSQILWLTRNLVNSVLPTESVNIGAKWDNAICSQALLSPAISTCAVACIVLRSEVQFSLYTCGRLLGD